MLMSHRLTRRIRTVLFLTAVTACGLMAFTERTSADDGAAYIGAVTADNVFVRSGPADSYYPIGRVNTGSLVNVTGERFGWARIHTIGPTFDRDDFFGYIIYPKTQPGRFRLADDGKTGRTLGRTDVLAPNLNTDFNPNDSWKPLIRLEADTTVRVLETLESANNIVQKIALPEEAEVWISARYIARADERQRAAWKRHFEPEKADTKPEEMRDRVKRETTDAPPAPPSSAPAPASAPPALGRDEQPAPDVEPLAEEHAEHSESEDVEPAVEDDEAETPDAPEHDVREPEPEPEAEPDEATTDEEAMEVREPTTAERLAEATLDDLEGAFEQLRTEPIETAEVDPLRRMYLELADRADDDRTQRFATLRAEQLAIWAEAQRNRQRLAQLKARAELTGDRASAARRAVDDAGDYTAVGRLAVSTIYDGRRLPQLLRLQEPGTGRTVAYVQPDTEYDLTNMIGQLIGVIGEKQYDGGLRLNLIHPRRVDILAPQ